MNGQVSTARSYILAGVSDHPADRDTAGIVGKLLLGTAGLSLILAVIIYLRANYDDQVVSFGAVFAWQFAVWLPWVLLAIIVRRLAQTFPYASFSPATWLLIHFVGAMSVAIVHYAWYFYISDNFSPYHGLENTKYGVFAWFFIFWFLLDLLLYGVLLASEYSREYYVRYRTNEQQLAELERALAEAEQTDAETPQALDYITVRKRGRQHVIPAGQIDWIEAQGYYAALHTSGDSFLVRESLNTLSDRLDSEQFIRVHRSTIVNVGFIQSLDPESSSAWSVTLMDGTRRRVSRSGKQRLARRIDRIA